MCMTRQRLPERYRWPLRASCGVILFGCACLAWENATQHSGQNTLGTGLRTRQEQGVVERQIIGAATQAFRPSLEMRENVDFLLTPALLVQEAMSPNVVVTYPCE